MANCDTNTGEKLATQANGTLNPLCKCWMRVPGYNNSNFGDGDGKITLRVLPEISDSKTAAYNDEPIMGRSFPLKTFSHGENRVINMNCPFIVTAKEDILRNISDMKALESAVYPREGSGNNPYQPPPVCQLQCGSLLDSRTSRHLPAPLCVVLRSYSVSFPGEVPWDQAWYLPYRFTVNLQWEVVYVTEKLPGQEQIMNGTDVKPTDTRLDGGKYFNNSETVDPPEPDSGGNIPLGPIPL